VGRSARNLALTSLIDLFISGRALRSRDEQANLLLTAMTSALGVHDRLAVQEVSVVQGIIPCEAGEKLLYFPTSCVLSSMSVLRNGTAVETAVAGREGAFGLLTVVGSGEMSVRCQVQIGGRSLIMAADVCRPFQRE
jgi:hypothetical protein